MDQNKVSAAILFIRIQYTGISRNNVEHSNRGIKQGRSIVTLLTGKNLSESIESVGMSSF
jgi:hypothetical protein